MNKPPWRYRAECRHQYRGDFVHRWYRERPDPGEVATELASLYDSSARLLRIVDFLEDEP